MVAHSCPQAKGQHMASFFTSETLGKNGPLHLSRKNGETTVPFSLAWGLGICDTSVCIWEGDTEIIRMQRVGWLSVSACLPSGLCTCKPTTHSIIPFWTLGPPLAVANYLL